MAGQLHNLRGTPGKRHEHLTRQTQNLPAADAGLAGRAAVQDVRRAAVDLAPGIQSTLLGRTQALAHQPLGHAHHPTLVIPARPLQFRPQHLCCLTDTAQGRLRVTGTALAPALPRCRILARRLVGIHRLQQGAGRALQTGRPTPDACLRSDDPQRRRIGAWITLLAAAYRAERLTADQLDAAAVYLGSGFVHATVVDPGETVLMVRVAPAAGLREIATSAVEFAEHRAQRHTCLPLCGTAAAHARGLLDCDPARLLSAAERYGSARPLLRAQALEDAGAFLEATASRDARTCFERTLEGYDTCGAGRESRRTRSRLRKLGIKTAVSSGTPDTGRRGLTLAELGVVRLIAHGATNRQAAERLFLSPHTVNTHLRHAFEKLGIRSRVQLARLYLQEVDQPAAAPS